MLSLAALPNRTGMNETDVRRIAEIVRQVQVAGSIVQGITEHYRPVRIVKFGKIKNLARIRQRRIPHPDPNQTESLARRIGSHDGIPWNDVLTGNTDAFASAVKSHSVITALDRVPLQPAKGKAEACGEDIGRRARQQSRRSICKELHSAQSQSDA